METFFKKIQESPIKMWPETVFNTAVEKLQKSKKVNEDKIKQVKEQIMLRHVRDKRRDQLQRLVLAQEFRKSELDSNTKSTP